MSDRILKDGFLKHFNLEPSGPKATQIPSKEDTGKLCNHVADLTQKSPGTVLSEGQRGQLSARRFQQGKAWCVSKVGG